MPTIKRTVEFASSEDGKWCRETLLSIEKDLAFYSGPSFTLDTEQFPNNEMPFVATHMNYLIKHPEVDPRHYISNLRLRLRKPR